MRLALIGCGHIGGSLALALRRAGAVAAIAGYDADPQAAARARERGICDEIAASAEAAAAGADVTVLAVPVRAIPEVAARLTTTGLVTDVGSTKVAIVAACGRRFGGRFVGGHPIAGTERAGPDAADVALFAGRKVILTPEPSTDPAALDRISGLWRSIGAEVITMDPARHDRIFATISHLPHAVAYALVRAIAAGGTEDLIGLTRGGFLDTTRIASTPPPMWVDVFIENRSELLPLLDSFVDAVRQLRAAIAASDAPALHRLLADARSARTKIVGE